MKKQIKATSQLTKIQVTKCIIEGAILTIAAFLPLVGLCFVVSLGN